MNKLVYLPELDSVRNSKREIIIGQNALYEEIVVNGNRVVLSFNQIADSTAFLSAVKDDEQYKFIVELFKKGYIMLSNYQYTDSNGNTHVVSSASQYIQNALEKNISDKNANDTFIFSELPIRKEEKELAAIMLKALRCGRPSIIKDSYKPVDRMDKKRVKYLIRYVSVLLALSREELANNPPKQTKGKSFIEFMHIVMQYKKDGNSNVVWNYFDEAILVLQNIECDINEAGKVGINARSNWIERIDAMPLKGLHTDKKNSIYLAEAIVNIIYNYTIEDSIHNISKHYIDTDDNNDFYMDFANRLEKYWDEFLDGVHILHKKDGDVSKFTLDTVEGLPKWETAVRVTTEKHERDEEKSKDEEDEILDDESLEKAGDDDSHDSDSNSIQESDNTLLYEDNHDIEKKRWRSRLRRNIAKQIMIAFIYIILFCAMDYVTGGIEDIVAALFELFDISFNAAATIIVNILVYTIVLGVVSSLISTFVNLPDILESLKDIWHSFRDIRRVKKAPRGIAYIFKRKRKS